MTTEATIIPFSRRADRPIALLPERFDIHRIPPAFEHEPRPGVRVAFDGSAVKFADARAIQWLVDAQKLVRDCGAELIVLDPSDVLHATLEMTGNTALLEIRQELAAA